MTKIGILALAQERNGGTLPYTLSMIEALQRLPQTGYTITLFTTEDNHEYDSLGLPIMRLPGPLNIAASRIGGEDLFGAVDKVIAPIYSALLLATRRPFAFTLHDLQEKYYPEHFSLATRVWRHTANRLLTARASCIICESHFVQRDIIRHFKVPASRIAVVPAPPAAIVRGNQLDEERLAAVRRKFDLPDCYIFYPAQFWPHKNHRRLIEAFARVAKAHPNCHLVLTGKKRDEYENVFKRIRELGLTSRVRHIGYVDQADLAPLYRCATVTAIPTLFESISIPVYEAFSVGTPVCASNVVALPEQIGDAGLLFDPLSAEDMAEKLNMLLAAPDLRQQLAERGHLRMAPVNHANYALRLGEIIDAMGEVANASAR